MNAVAEFIANAKAASRLKPKFYAATSIVAVLAAVAGLAVVILAVAVADALLNVNIESLINESPNRELWAWSVILAIPVSFVIVKAPVAWVCGLVFVRIGYMDRADLKHYALRSRFPAHWFKEGAIQATAR
jgi:energy-converting hydrogenase Eha subunit A